MPAVAMLATGTCGASQCGLNKMKSVCSSMPLGFHSPAILSATCAQESPMRVDHNRSSYGAFPAFKRGFDSGFAALSARGARHGVAGEGDEGSTAAALLPSDHFEQRWRPLDG
jgi:hypothetical protein